MMREWQEKAIFVTYDPFQQEMSDNGRQLLYFLVDFLADERQIEDLRPLCDKIAAERVQAYGKIGDFVYNANIGRSVLLDALCRLDAGKSELQVLLQKIQESFDYFVYYTVLTYSDIVSRNLEEKQQFIDETHKERLTILGQMSASFVHEFRNPLTSIMGFVKLLRGSYPDLPYLDIVSHELDQLNFRISQFLLVSRKEMWDEKETFMLRDLFGDMIQFLYPSLVNANVEVEQQFVSPIQFTGYRNEIRQVLLNILMNSIDALESVGRERKIVIRAFEDQEGIHITIQNNGPMIPADRMRTIFEPFVTTKKLGTGIGLFVCRKIVEKHQGSISCESTPEWTKFILSFQKQI